MSSSEEDERVHKGKKGKIPKKNRRDESEDSESEYEDGSSDSEDSYFSYDSDSVSGDEYEQEYENRSKKISLDDLPEPVRVAYLEKHKLWEEKVMTDLPEVTISDPYKEGNFISSYVTYLINVKGWSGTVDSSKFKYSVRRRYSDFEWLYYAMLYRYPGILIDKLPPKKMVNNFDKEFIDERLHGLQRFMNNISSNVYLANDNIFKDFVILSDIEFYNLRNNNSKQSFYDFGLLKDVLVNDQKHLSGFKTTVLHVRDTRPNEGLSRWNNFLRHLKAPVQVQQALRNLNDHVVSCVRNLTRIKSALQGMIVDGTSLTNITKEFKLSLNDYINMSVSNIQNIEKLDLNDTTREKYNLLINYSKELAASVEVWHELQFFQPQEIVPELIYEFEKQLDNYSGLRELLFRHEAMVSDYSRSWKLRDTQQFEMTQAKANGDKSKFGRLRKQFFDLDYQCKINRFVLQQISKAIIYCEYEKFINLRCDSLIKSINNFAHLQISIAERNISRWKLLIKNVGLKVDDELLDECDERIDLGCGFKLDNISDSEGNDESDRDEKSKISSKSNSESEDGK